MKNQRFRYKLIALLLMGLLLLAGVYGIRTIPLTGPSDSLRDSILRLTGQSASPPAESPSPSPDGISAESQESAAGESRADDSGSSSPGASFGESPADSSEGIPSGAFTPGESDRSPAGASGGSPDAVSSESPVSSPGVSESPEPPDTNGLGGIASSPAASSVPPLSEALSSYFGTEAPSGP